MRNHRIFTADDREPETHKTARMEEFAAFLNALSKGRKSYTVTPWQSTDGHEHGFCVWYR